MGKYKSVSVVFLFLIFIFGNNYPTIDSSGGSGTCWADTTVGGAVSGLWTLSASPFVVQDSAWVNSGQTLTIEPGVEVKFWYVNIGLTVYGILNAQGTEQDTIRFIPYYPGPTSNWKYITFYGSSSSNSVMRYCEVKQGQKGIRAENSSPIIAHCSIHDNLGQGVRTQNSSLILDSCDIYNNDSSAVVIHNGIPHIRGNNIFDNTGKGVYLDQLSGGEISYNIVENNGDFGIYGYNGCLNVDIAYNTIGNNDNEGIFLEGNCRNIDIIHNIIFGNGYYGIKIDDCNALNPSVNINYNTIYDNYFEGIYSDNSKSYVINNTIVFNNRHGIFGYQGNMTVYNNIVAENANDGIFVQSLIVYPNYNDFWLNGGDDYNGCSAGLYDLNADPLFTDPYFNDYTLQDSSPCIDAGNPATFYNDPDGTRNDIGAWYFNQSAVGRRWSDKIPVSCNLLIGYPNPFNETVDLELEVTTDFTLYGKIEIFDIYGRLVNSLTLVPGIFTYKWEGDDYKGTALPSGVYFCRTEFTAPLKLILLK